MFFNTSFHVYIRMFCVHITHFFFANSFLTVLKAVLGLVLFFHFLCARWVHYVQHHRQTIVGFQDFLDLYFWNVISSSCSADILELTDVSLFYRTLTCLNIQMTWRPLLLRNIMKRNTVSGNVGWNPGSCIDHWVIFICCSVSLYQ